MPYIKVNTGKIGTYISELENCRKVLNNTNQAFSDLYYSMDWNLRSSSSIGSDMEQICDQAYCEATSITNMKQYLQTAVDVYNGEEIVVKEASKNSKGENAFDIDSLKAKIAGLRGIKKAIDASKIKKVFKDGKVYVSGYQRDKLYNGLHLTGRYNYSTWIEQQSKLTKTETVGLFIKGIVKTYNMASNLKDVWSDENKDTEKKVCDTIANVGCTAASIAVEVAGKIVSKAIVAAIPIPVVGSVVGAAAGVVLDAYAQAFASEAVINQTSDAIENVVGAAKAGCQAVSDKAKEIANAQGLDKAKKVAETVGTAAKEIAKVAVVATVESVKTYTTVVKETAKNAVNTVKNFFKGW